MHEYPLLQMPFLSACPADKTQERTQEVPHRTAAAAANLRVQRLPEKKGAHLESISDNLAGTFACS